jgi:tripartite ATP-independent transporter DctP family solute receptor
MKKLIAMLTVLLLAIGFAGCGGSGSGGDSGGDADGGGAAANPIVIKAGHVEAEDRAIHQTLLRFGEYINEESGGALVLEVYPNSELGSDSDVIDAIGLGTIQMNIGGSAVYTRYDEKFAVLSLPYMFESREQMNAAFTGEFGDVIGEWFEDYGFVCLGYQYDGARSMSNNLRPITSVADMSGIKFRVMDSDKYINMFKMLGANPTPMGYGEIYTALQQGVIDGQDNPPGLTYGSKFHENLKYFSLTEHVYSNCPVVIGKPFFDGLDPEYQEIIRTGAKIYLEDQQREEETALEAEFTDDIAAAGVAVNKLTPEAIAEFKTALEPLYDQYRETLGADLMDQVLELAAK